MKIVAHTLEGRPEHEWEPLFTPFGDEMGLCGAECCPACKAFAANHGHLNKVAHAAGRFAEQMFSPQSNEALAARQWGYLAGLWHDFGKFAPEWQAYLRSRIAEIHTDELSGRMDHATAGAVFACRSGSLGELMAYVIAGHHSGLADGPQLFEERLKKKLPEWEPAVSKAGLLGQCSLPMPPLKRKDARNDDMAFMLRFFYSCLVDADFLATESFMQPSRSSEREEWPDNTLDLMLAALERHLANAFSGKQGPVNRSREEVQNACAEAAEHAPGFFSLTVPTGGGKTLSSLLFALRHAKKHGLRRVIYVIPFTSIIAQNAQVFRECFAEISQKFGREIVLEHHSKFDPDQETAQTRIAAENWDAPVIVTTNVQFFESLYANRTGACRKLHRIARSVVVLDEVQALPLDLLTPILRGLRCLVKDLHCSAVLCTATQPALLQRDDFTVGIPEDEITEIIPDRESLFQTLRRTTSHRLGKLHDDELIGHALLHAPNGCLIVVNTTEAAQSLFLRIQDKAKALHLSARMCPAHVMAVLAEAKELRKMGVPLVLVSTQLIEAGVDISFPAVYRAECGIDAFAQAAGRCNRNGELSDETGQPKYGNVYFFESADHPIPSILSDMKTAADISHGHILPNFDQSELLSLEAVQRYFEHAIWQAGAKTDRWDKQHIVSGDIPCFPRSGTRSYLFKTAADRFRMIPSNTHPIIIPWGEEGRRLSEELRHLSRFKVPPARSHYRRAQQYSVQVYEPEWKDIENKVELLCEGAFPTLIHPENDYDPLTGLRRLSNADNIHGFIL